MAEPPMKTSRTASQLLSIAVLMGIGYTCIHVLRFTNETLNFISVCAIYAIPFLALRPVLRLQRRPKTWGLIVVSPLLLLSSFLLLGKVVFEGLLGQPEERQPLQTFQQGNGSIQLQRYEFGGAVGVHGLDLEQQRPIVPGLYIVKSIDFFDSARDGTLSLEAPNKVRVRANGNFHNNAYVIDRVYTLKPWVYF